MLNIIEWFKSRRRRKTSAWSKGKRDLTVVVYVDGRKRFYFGHLTDFNGREDDDFSLISIVNGIVANKQHYMDRCRKGRVNV